METKYSVLMSVYHKENPEYFKASIESMLNQTIPPDEIVIVKDGLLGEELEAAATLFLKYENIVFVQLKENRGLGEALRIGLRHCKNEFVARMDTDDISMPERCERQLRCFAKNTELSLVGTDIMEFIDIPDNIVSYRKVPSTDFEIKEGMKRRNPFNHMTVMFKKGCVVAAGDYRSFNLNEDYFLWVRMRLKNYRFENINAPLVKVRINKATFERRGGWEYFLVNKRIYDFMLKKSVISLIEYALVIFLSLGIRVVSNDGIRQWIYMKVLRREIS